MATIQSNLQSSAESETQPRSIGVGVIGFGGRAGVVIAHAFEQDSRFELVAVCDPDSTSRDKARKLEPKVEFFDDYQALVNDERVDWVAVCSPNGAHRGHAVAAIEAGKPVFCEKPLATTVEDCLAIAEAWRGGQNSFAIGFVLRYSPHYRKIRELLEARTIGDLVSVEFNETLRPHHGGFMASDWRRLTEHSGGFLLEKCCHDIDLVNWFIDGRATHVASFGGNDIFKPEHAYFIDHAGNNPDNGKPLYSSWHRAERPLDPFNSDKDTIDNQVVIFQYDNGVRASFHTNMHTGLHERRMYLCGTQGTLRADMVSGRIELRTVWSDSEVEDHSVGELGGHGGGEQTLGREVARCMTSAQQPAAGLKDGLVSAITCLGADQARQEGRIVDLTPTWKRVDALLGQAGHR